VPEIFTGGTLHFFFGEKIKFITIYDFLPGKIETVPGFWTFLDPFITFFNFVPGFLRLFWNFLRYTRALATQKKIGQFHTVCFIFPDRMKILAIFYLNFYNLIKQYGYTKQKRIPRQWVF